jgi:hypothetical protein
VKRGETVRLDNPEMSLPKSAVAAYNRIRKWKKGSVDLSVPGGVLFTPRRGEHFGNVHALAYRFVDPSPMEKSGFKGIIMAGGDDMAANTLLPDETKKYFEAHPDVAEQLLRAEKAYKTLGEYLNLTQSRVVVRESGASTNEVDLSATILRTDL